MRLRRQRTVACPACGATVPATARWCGACGEPLRDRATAPDEAGTNDTVTDRAGRDGRTGRLAAALVVVGIFASLLATRTPTAAPEVPAGFTARGDGARTGVVATSAPQPTGVAWRQSVVLPPLLAPSARILGMTTADGRDVAVVLDPAPDGQRITAHDQATGEVVTTAMLPLDGQAASVTIGEGLLVHRSIDHVTTVDLATGQRRWRVEERWLDDAAATPFGVVGRPADDDGVLLLLDQATGAAIWTSDPTLTTGPATIAVIGDVVVAVQPDLVTAFRATDGEFAWEVLPQDLVGWRGTPLLTATSHGDLLLVRGTEGVAVLRADGTVVLSQGVDTDPTNSLLQPVAADVTGDLLVVPAGPDVLLGFDLLDGGVWETEVTMAPGATVEVVEDTVALHGTTATVLLDAATGARRGLIARGDDVATPALRDDGRVLRLLDDGSLAASDPDGDVWRVPTVATHVPDLATDDGAVAVTTPDGVQVHDVEDGGRRFAHLAFDPTLVVAGSLTPPALTAGRAIIAPAVTQPADRGGLLGVFADTGIVSWARDADRVVPRGTPVVDRDLVLVPVGSQVLGFEPSSGRRALVVETTIARTDLAAADGWIAAVDGPRDRGDLWVGRRATRDLVFRAPIRTCAPPVIHDDVVIVVDHLDDIVARELETGEQPWGERARGSACRPLTVAGEVLIALVDDRELVGIGLDDGDTDWRTALPAHAAGAPVVAGDLVLVPTLAGEVLAYAATTTEDPGEPVWRVDVGGVPAGSVAVDGDTVLVLTREGELVALR